MVEYIKNLAEQVKQQGTKPHNHTTSNAPTSVLRRAVITAVNTSGGTSTYDVAVISVDGSTSDTIKGCTVWGNTSYAVNDKVWILYDGLRPVPFVLSSASGGGTSEFVPVIVSTLGFVS